MHGIARVAAGRPFRRIGLSENDRPRGTQAGNGAGVSSGDVVRKQRAAVGGAETGGILRILDENRQAMQRSQAVTRNWASA
jgi:hypothetical protein